MPAAAYAAETPVPPAAEDDDSNADDPLEVQGDEIIVLAPRIMGQIDVPQQPIEVFDENDIASYGASSIEELLEAISPQTGSGRGRGDGRPVMLLNGQRITSFREMRNIPPEAIRRVEVLPEEVALRFGYAANQRVVNIILKEQFAAVTASGEYNRPTRGGYDNYELESGLFSISGPRRYNVTAKLDETSMLTEAERNIIQDDSRTSDLATDPDPARYRSLAGKDSELVLEGTMTQGLGEKGLAGAITVTGGYTRSQTTSLSGLDTVTLTDDSGSLQRTLPDPLTTRAISDTFEGGLGYSTMVGEWQLSATANATYADSSTRVDRRRDGSDLQAQVDAGALAIDGALPFVPGAGVDVATTRQLTLSNLATISGKPFRMPAGEANLTVKAGYDFDRSSSEDTRNTLGAVTLKRGDVLGGVNLALPLTSKGEDFLGAVGDLTLNLSGGLDRLSDFGTLSNWSAGLTWSPTEKLSFQASYIVEEAAPKLTQLAAPNILTYNVAVYDFTTSRTALVTTISGGNPNLRKETQRDIKLSAQWQLPFLSRSSLIVEYFRNRSSDVTQSFPLLTPAVEAAFSDRVTRDAAGNLIALDRRPVTFDEVKTSSMRWGINLSGSLGDSSSSSTSTGGAGRAAAAPEGAPAAPVTGPNGPMPGVQTLGGKPAGVPGGRPGFDPARFAAVRQQLCAPGATAPDLSQMPEGLRQRLLGADGKIDPAKLAEFKERACAADGANGPAGPGGPGEGAFDPQRFERIRTALCSGGSGPPDITSLPSRMRERLVGADGKVDPQRLEQLRARFCTADGSATTSGSAGSGAPAPAGDAMREMRSAGGPPPMQSSGGGAPRGEGGMNGRGPGGPSMGPGGPPMGPGGPRGSRWNIAVYHTWRFTDTVSIAPGVPVLDELDGDAIAAGGVPRHAIEAEGGLFKNGYGLRLKAEWEAPARVNGSGAPGSSDLRFGSTFDVSLRIFADLGRNEDLVARMPFLKGTRLSLVADNLLDSRQRVTDENGDTPIAYQPGYRAPQGRVLGIDFRKLF
ncbi:TonB-dependent receptor domain-containing protein [Novosphingobium soli]|uniref:TonB-dependent receptor domain-containing protein n=1 Tax=Novosphingobium soli TaxID=574956 RepID=A0ABV6D132_9SPHN